MPKRSQFNTNAMPMAEIVCGRAQEEYFYGWLRVESFREGVQCEPLLWDGSIGISLMGGSTGIIMRREVLELASAMPTQCQRIAAPMPKRPQPNANALPMGEILCGRCQ
eukprot:4873243-Pyramimonas_sp.AAC.1